MRPSSPMCPLIDCPQGGSLCLRSGGVFDTASGDAAGRQAQSLAKLVALNLARVGARQLGDDLEAAGTLMVGQDPSQPSACVLERRAPPRVCRGHDKEHDYFE